MDQRTHFINVVVEKLEVLVLWEVLKHLLEAKLKEEVTPCEGRGIILNHSGLAYVSHVLTVVSKGDVLTECIILVLDGVEVSDLYVIIIIQSCIVSGRRFLADSSVRL
jgi:hypothetical protein